MDELLISVSNSVCTSEKDVAENFQELLLLEATARSLEEESLDVSLSIKVSSASTMVSIGSGSLRLSSVGFSAGAASGAASAFGSVLFRFLFLLVRLRLLLSAISGASGC